MAEKSLLIVGGGMAGLAAGCYAQMNGYRSEILEAGRVAGGLCSAWTRKGYTFDTSIHFLAGWKSGALRAVWEELGAVQGREFIVHEEAGRIEAQGKTLVVHRDLDRFEEHLLSFSSADAARIHELIDLARRCTTLDMPVGKPPELLGPIGLARMLFQIRPFLSIWRKYSKLSIQTFAAGFRDPFLREAVRLLGDGTAWPMPDRPLASVAMQLAWEHTGNAGAPVGGSQPLIQAIVRRYQGLGGTISYASRVTKVLVEEGRAIGVRLDDGTERRADAVLSAADGRTTLYDWLDGRYLPPACPEGVRDVAGLPADPPGLPRRRPRPLGRALRGGLPAPETPRRRGGGADPLRRPPFLLRQDHGPGREVGRPGLVPHELQPPSRRSPPTGHATKPRRRRSRRRRSPSSTAASPGSPRTSRS